MQLRAFIVNIALMASFASDQNSFNKQINICETGHYNQLGQELIVTLAQTN